MPSQPDAMSGWAAVHWRRADSRLSQSPRVAAIWLKLQRYRLGHALVTVTSCTLRGLLTVPTVPWRIPKSSRMKRVLRRAAEHAISRLTTTS
jgi:hypothetical protein